MDILEKLAADQEESHRRVRAMLSGAALAEYDAGMEEIRSGRYDLAMLWHSISEPQRRLVRLLSVGNRILTRCSFSNHFYDVRGEPEAVSKAAGLGTVSALVRHGILRWTGRSNDVGQKVEIASRGYALIAFLRTRN